VRWSSGAGVVVAIDNLVPVWEALGHPATLAGLAVFALACVLVERRLRTAPEFALGVLLGVLSVLATTLLTGLVLLADGAERWGTFVSAVFVVHLPIALLEGLILGCTVGFLARVKPEMLGQAGERGASGKSEPVEEVALEPGVAIRGLTPPARLPMILFLSLAALLLSAPSAWAHRLLAEHKVDRAAHRVTVESWYETDDPPTDARARVLRADGSILAEGPVDAKGVFVFTYERVEPLTVHIDAPGGHRAVCKIAADELSSATAREEGGAEAPRRRVVPRESNDAERVRTLIVGLGFLLGLWSFVLSWLNARRLRRLEERMERGPESPGR
jgi:hypothetical protein